MSSVIALHTGSVALGTPLNGIPMPDVERIAGFTMTMQAIVNIV